MDLKTYESLVKIESVAIKFVVEFCLKNHRRFCSFCRCRKRWKLSEGRRRCQRCSNTYHDLTGRWWNQLNIRVDDWLRVIKLFELELSARRISEQTGLAYNTVHKALMILRHASSFMPKMLTDDAAVVGELLDQTSHRTKKLGGDGAYDKWKVYRTLDRRGIKPIIPPRSNAKIKRNGNRRLPPLPRDEAIRGICQHGRAEWKRQVGYHRRSLSETAMYRILCSSKGTTFGPMLKNRNEESQKTEARLRCKILNHFTKLGLPKFVFE